MTACELDGSVRIVIDSDRLGQTFRCPFCRGVERIDYEPTASNDLQREFR